MTKKLYLADIIILDSKDISPKQGNIISKVECDSVLVRRKGLGYEEVYTNHMLYKHNILSNRCATDREQYPWIITSNKALRQLRETGKYFVIDTDSITSITPATEEIIEYYTECSDENPIKIFYEQRETLSVQKVKK